MSCPQPLEFHSHPVRSQSSLTVIYLRSMTNAFAPFGKLVRRPEVSVQVSSEVQRQPVRTMRQVAVRCLFQLIAMQLMETCTACRMRAHLHSEYSS